MPISFFTLSNVLSNVRYALAEASAIAGRSTSEKRPLYDQRSMQEQCEKAREAVRGIELPPGFEIDFERIIALGSSDDQEQRLLALGEIRDYHKRVEGMIVEKLKESARQAEAVVDDIPDNVDEMVALVQEMVEKHGRLYNQCYPSRPFWVEHFDGYAVYEDGEERRLRDMLRSPGADTYRVPQAEALAIAKDKSLAFYQWTQAIRDRTTTIGEQLAIMARVNGIDPLPLERYLEFWRFDHEEGGVDNERRLFSLCLRRIRTAVRAGHERAPKTERTPTNDRPIRLPDPQYVWDLCKIFELHRSTYEMNRRPDGMLPEEDRNKADAWDAAGIMAHCLRSFAAIADELRLDNRRTELMVNILFEGGDIRTLVADKILEHGDEIYDIVQSIKTTAEIEKKKQLLGLVPATPKPAEREPQLGGRTLRQLTEDYYDSMRTLVGLCDFGREYADADRWMSAILKFDAERASFDRAVSEMRKAGRIPQSRFLLKLPQWSRVYFGTMYCDDPFEALSHAGWMLDRDADRLIPCRVEERAFLDVSLPGRLELLAEHFKPMQGTWAELGELRDLCYALCSKIDTEGTAPDADDDDDLASGETAELPPDARLGSRDIAALKLILDLPPSGAIKGAEIVTALLKMKPAISMSESTLTSDVIPKLKRYYSVQSARKLGYFIDEDKKQRIRGILGQPEVNGGVKFQDMGPIGA